MKHILKAVIALLGVLLLTSAEAHAQYHYSPSTTTSAGAFDATSFGAISDGGTDNTTTITNLFAASNTVTSGIPLVHFGCQTGKQCQYNYGGTGTSPINPTIPTTIQCDPGVTLKYTGSAHAMDIGPTGLTLSTYVNQPYRISGCRLIDTGSETHGIYVNQFIVWFKADNLTFYDSPASASASAWPIYLAGFNWDADIYDNSWIVDTNTAINEGVYAYPADISSQVRFHDNHLVCVNGTHGTTGCTTGGSGPVISGWGSLFNGNNIAFLRPDIQVLSGANYSKITSNYFESAPSSNSPIIEYGASGDAAGTYIDGLAIANNSFDTQGSSTDSFLGPGSANDLLTNVKIDGLQGLNVSGSSVIVAENNTAGQTGNEVQHVCASTGTTPPCPINFNIHTLNTNIANWNYVGQGNYSDMFTGSGALAAPWGNITGSGIGGPLSVSSGLVSCTGSTCESMYDADVTGSQHAEIAFATVPTGTDQAFVYTRMSGSLISGSFSGYDCVYVSGTGIQLYKNISGAFTQLGSTYTTTTPIAGDSLILESRATSQTCYLLHYVSGVPEQLITVSTTDSALSNGFVGLGLAGTTGRLKGPFVGKSIP